jgi:hypothetical protein
VQPLSSTSRQWGKGARTGPRGAAASRPTGPWPDLARPVPAGSSLVPPRTEVAAGNLEDGSLPAGTTTVVTAERIARHLGGAPGMRWGRSPARSYHGEAGADGARARLILPSRSCHGEAGADGARAPPTRSTAHRSPPSLPFPFLSCPTAHALMLRLTRNLPNGVTGGQGEGAYSSA